MRPIEFRGKCIDTNWGIEQSFSHGSHGRCKSERMPGAIGGE